MGDFAFSKSLTYVQGAGFNLASTTLTGITSGSGSKGSWTEVITSSNTDSDFVTITIDLTDSTVEDILIDIGIGAAASEVAIIENLLYSGRGSTTVLPQIYQLPIRVQAGTRISARASADGAVTVGVGVELYVGGEKSFGYCCARGYGVNTGTHSGTAVDCGGTANTKGAWTELVASTTEDINGFYVFVGINDNLTINIPGYRFVDIGIGAAASEAVIVSNHAGYASTNEQSVQAVFYDMKIPAGTRISARGQCPDTDASDRVVTVALVGIN